MLDLKQVKNDPEVCAIMTVADIHTKNLGYTEHSTRHSSIVSKWAGDIIRKIGGNEREINLAEIAGYLHDIGNSVNRIDHSQSGGLLAYNILVRMGMDYLSAAEIMMAIGNHDESTGTPVSDISAALILADKSDVRRSRVRQKDIASFDIHDRVNYAVSKKEINFDGKEFTLILEIDNSISSILNYFEIFTKRMILCQRASEFLKIKFSLVINGTKMI